MRSLAALVLLESLAAAAGASPLWDDVAHPDRPRCDALARDIKTRIGLAVRIDVQVPAAAQLVALAVEAGRRCPDHRDVQMWLGHVKVLEQDYRAALAPLERARKLEDADPRASPDASLAFDLGLVRAVAGDLDGSLDEYRRAEAIGFPGRLALLLYDMGDTYQALGRLEEAIDAYRRAARLDPREAIHHWALAVALDRDGQLAAARGEVELALLLDPHLLDELSERYFFVPPADHWYYLAIAYRSQGKVDRAREAIGNFLHDLPDGPYSARARELQATLQR